MMNKCLVIADGYVLHSENIKMPLEAAREILLTKKQHRYVCARRKEDQAVLTRHILWCPTCGYRQTATRRSVMGESPERIHKRDIELWACGAEQIALWDNGFLEIDQAVKPQQWECPGCGAIHGPEKGRIAVRVTTEKNKINIVCRGVYAGQFLFETLEFNARRGRVVFTQYKPWEGKKIIRDVTILPSWFRESAIHNLIEKNIRLRKIVYRHLRNIWGKPLPYRLHGLRTEMLFAMCRFVGYHKSFYEAVPWCDGWEIHPHFSQISQKLQNAKNISKVLADMKPLSDFRSIRRLLMEQPGILFYHREATVLLDVMRYDPGSFCNLLRGRHGYFLLSELAAYPGMINFLKDYIRVRGIAALQRQLDKSAGVLRLYSLEYHAMDPRRRQQEQQVWKRGSTEFLPGPGFSKPLRLGEGRIDGQSGRYVFRYLRSTQEIQECGRYLNSYLEALPEGTVIAITCGTQIVGAAQIYEDRVVHTEGSDNQPLPGEPLREFEAWCNECGLRLPDDEDDVVYCF